MSFAGEVKGLARSFAQVVWRLARPAVRFAPLYSRWMTLQPIFAIELGVLLMVALGGIGSDFGLANLFWHDSPAIQATAGASVVAFAMLLWFLSYLLHPSSEAIAAHALATLDLRGPIPWREPQPSLGLPDDPALRLRLVLRAMFVPLGVVLCVAALWRAIATPDVAIWPGLWPMPAGAVAMAFVAEGVLRRVARRGWTRGGWVSRNWFRLGAATGLVPVAMVHILARYEWTAWSVTAVVALCAVLAELALVAYLTHGQPLTRVAMTAVLVLVVGWANGRDMYKLTYPELEYPEPDTIVVDQPAAAVQPRPRVSSAAEAVTRGQAWFDASDFVGAIDAFDQAIRLDPKNVVARVGLGRAHANQAIELVGAGDSAGAIAESGKAISFIPQDFEGGDLAVSVWQLRGFLLATLNDYDGAIADWDRTQEIHRSNEPRLGGAGFFEGALVRACAQRGLKRLGLGNFSGAIADLDRAIKYERFSGPDAFEVPAPSIDEKNEYRAARNLAVLLNTNPQNAIAGVDLLIQERPRDALLRRARADLLAGRANFIDAVDEYTKAIGLDERDAAGLEGRAACYARMGRDDLAYQDHIRAEARHERATALAAAELNAIVRKGKSARHGTEPPEPLRRVDDLEALEAWRSSVQPGDAPKPVLVVVATSGGGIAAAYWTAGCLAEIEKRCPEFPRQVRAIFGASGGMVGAAVYVSGIQKPPATRSISTLEDLISVVGADSLTPTVRRMLLGDLPSIFDPNRQSDDRGRALERTWAQNTRGATSRPMSDLAEGESGGWRPSLVISPMLVEEASFLLISNLDLHGLGAWEEFFESYPLAYGRLTLGTALRMNAAFPFVSPGVYLPATLSPTKKPPRRVVPPRRIVDAGYLDIYGVDLACAWIFQNRGWLLSKTSGVRLVELRAYPIQSELGSAELRTRIAAGFQFLTTPLEGVNSVRQQSMISRNRKSVDRLKDWFNDGKDAPKFFDNETFICDDPPPLGWSLTAADRAKIDRALRRIGGSTEKVVKWIQSAGPIPTQVGGAARK